MISVEEALETILSRISPLEAEDTSILSASGRVIAEDIRSGRHNPPSDNSAMDGYAVRFEDVQNADEQSPALLKIIGEQPAGHDLEKKVKPGEALRIMTGASMAEGADTVVQVEHTKGSEDQCVSIFKAPLKRGLNVRIKGEYFREEDIVLKKGTEITSLEVGLLASLGLSRVPVFRQPTVSILATGDEIIELGNSSPASHQIFNSNSFFLSAQVEESGGVPVNLGIARDNEADIEKRLKKGCESDILISTGGVSVGNFDYVKAVLENMGSDLTFWKVAIKPGKPLVFGKIHGKIFFGLPGNPVASFIAFHQFVRPALKKLGGVSVHQNHYFFARLEKDLSRKPDKRKVFIASLIHEKEGELFAKPLSGQSSGNVRSLCECNGFLILEGENAVFKKGDKIPAFFSKKNPNFSLQPN